VPRINERFTYLANEYLPQTLPYDLHPPAKQLCPEHCCNKSLPTTPPSDPIVALRLLTINIDEDLFMLLPSPDGDGYSLQSFIWCYPVGFDSRDKLGLKLREAHKFVLGNGEKFQRNVGIVILGSWRLGRLCIK
jgi:hypothetical protein